MSKMPRKTSPEADQLAQVLREKRKLEAQLKVLELRKWALALAMTHPKAASFNWDVMCEVAEAALKYVTAQEQIPWLKVYDQPDQTASSEPSGSPPSSPPP